MLIQQADDIAYGLRDSSYRKHMNCCNHLSIIAKGEVYELSEARAIHIFARHGESYYP